VTTKFSFSVEIDKEGLVFGKRSFSNDKNFMVSVSVSFGKVDALIEIRSLSKKIFYRINLIFLFEREDN